MNSVWDVSIHFFDPFVNEIYSYKSKLMVYHKKLEDLPPGKDWRLLSQGQFLVSGIIANRWGATGGPMCTPPHYSLEQIFLGPLAVVIWEIDG